MCDHCGCSDDHHQHHAGEADAAHRRAHELGLPRHHHHDAPAADPAVAVILKENDRLAERNRGFFLAKKLLVLNVLSAPGAGKTALLESTIRDTKARWRTAVITGDLQTENDATRLRAAGGIAIQITTGSACHLDAHMVMHALEKLDLDALDVLFIENVGNLVCPTLFDLGEDARVALWSVTEGEDKPVKYPQVFQSAALTVISKTDLAAVTEFKRAEALEHLRAIAPHTEVIELSSQAGTNLEAWYRWVEARLHAKRAQKLH
ncbi:MAG: hydrogenase accessory protein HypB [Verrucomicrobia bacterium]|nr:MAG: hydrogenase accessory protein HypB [Verrucomicrobiota bacterium]